MSEVLPHAVEEQSHVLIPLPDGTRLSARIWRPVGAGPVPAILEYLPYHWRDATAARDALNHPFLAAHGYVCLRVDTRGNGESEGVMFDEYTETELADGGDVIAWIAAQDWCSGAVGMQGISWGGFNGLQVAMRRPPALKAVVTLCSTTDRFADDIHYKGGVMLAENPGWAATALSWFSTPPDPALVGDAWRAMWMERLEATPDLATRWASHSHRDDYWRHGSVCEDWGAIEAAVLSIGGWHDGYRNTPALLLEHLDAPCRAIVGPWNHKYPHIAAPGPQIDGLGEMLRWYDHWLKGLDTGVMDDPPYRVWLMDSEPPNANFTHRPGRWVGQDSAFGGPQRVLHLNGAHLSDAPGPTDRAARTEAGQGQGTGEYFPFNYGPAEMPTDQRGDDALSLCFDAHDQPETEIIGAPVVRLRLRSDQTRGQVVLRLCDLRPDGSSAFITMGLLNLRHRDDPHAPRDTVPGEEMEVEITLDQIAYRLPAGHGLRLAIAPSYFPFAFPAADPVTLTVTEGHLSLPLRAGADWDGFGAPPRAAPPLAQEVLVPAATRHQITEDRAAGTLTTRIVQDDGVVRNAEHGLELGLCVTETYTIPKADPGAAEARFHQARAKGRGDWQIRTECEVHQRGDGPDFVITSWLKAWDGETLVFERQWDARVPRG